MTRQTLLGLLFLLIGLAIIAVVLAPVVLAIKAHTAPADLSVMQLVIGLAVTVFGAIVIPSSGAAPAIQNILVLASTTNLPFIGGAARRTTTTVQTTQTPKDGAP